MILSLKSSEFLPSQKVANIKNGVFAEIYSLFVGKILERSLEPEFAQNEKPKIPKFSDLVVMFCGKHSILYLTTFELVPCRNVDNIKVGT